MGVNPHLIDEICIRAFDLDGMRGQFRVKRHGTMDVAGYEARVDFPFGENSDSFKPKPR
jgi:hypothetical protein